MYQLDYEHKKQNGWACFDIAVGFERKQLIDFALKNIHLLEFRQLLAPEIRHAAALAVVYMNLCDDENAKNAERISELFMLAQALKDKVSEEQLEAQAFDLLQSDTGIELSQFALPISMHTKQLQKIINNYVQAHEDMRKAVAVCNQALGHKEGKYLSLEELDHHFSNPSNQNQSAYLAYRQARSSLFTPSESAFIEYCLNEDICQQYIQQYYNKRGWCSFQLSFHGETNTSMVDIAARMVGKSIVIHDMNNLEKILYPAKIINLEEIHIAFNGHSHFIGMRSLNKIQAVNQYRTKNSLVKRPHEISKELPSVLNPEVYSQDKRTDLLPGLAGSLYQGDATISYILEGIEKKLHFDIRPEVGDSDKWDDIKITYADKKTKSVTKILYIQSKHGYAKDSYLLPGNFYNKSGKAQMTISGTKLTSNTDVFTLPMYFDDWLKLKSTTDKLVFDKTEFVLFSNRSLCNQVDGFSNCFERNQLSQAFINKTGIYAKENGSNPAEKNQIGFRGELFKSLLNNSDYLKKTQLTPKEKNNQIKLFLNKVTFRLGEKHLDDIEQENKERIAKLYPHINADAIYYAFRFEVHKWIRDEDTATSFTDDTINKLLDSAATQYLTLGQWIGTTSNKLREILIKPRILLRRDKITQRLSSNISFNISKQYHLFVISGPSQSGKSFAIAEVLEQKIANKELIPGEILYITASELESFENNLLKVTALKFVVLDLGSSKPEKGLLANFCLKAKENSVKIFLIMRAEYIKQVESKLNINEHIVINYLTDEEMNTNIQQLSLSDSEVTIERKKFSFVTNYLSLKPLLQFPNRFCEIALSSFAVKKIHQLITEEEVYIKQDINEQLPIYSLLELLEINTRVELFLTIDLIESSDDTAIEVLNKSGAFIVIDLYELIEKYKNNQLDLTKIAQAKLVNNKRNQDKVFDWIIKADKVELESLPDNLRFELNRQGRVIYVRKGAIHLQNVLLCQIHQVNQADILILPLFRNDHLKLPKSAGYIDAKQQTQAATIIEKTAQKPCQIVIVAPAGAGKSTFTKKVQEAWLKGESGNHIAWVCRVRLGKLRKKDNNRSLEEIIIERIKQKLSDWQSEYIRHAISTKQLLLILDGWDEVKEQQQQDCHTILTKLFDYPNLIVTTRPNDFSSIPLINFDYIKLLPFDLPKIKQYVQSFFGNSKFSKLVCDYLDQPQTKELHDLIGVPMQCFLLCKALEPYYHHWINDSDIVIMPWQKQTLSKSRLYQLFTSASLQSYLTKHEGMYEVSDKKAFNRCRTELTRLQEIAFAQFFDTDNEFYYDEELDGAISYFGFVDPIMPLNGPIVYNFKHQTYIEYYSAIYLVNKLISSNIEEREIATNIIKDKRYVPRYRLVWQFIAGSISYGDPQLCKIPTYVDIERFWASLCMEPIDIIGIVHNSIMKDCLRNSNWQVIEQTRLGETLSELHEENATSQSLLDITQDSINDLSIANLQLTEKQSTVSASNKKQALTEMIESLNQYLNDNKKDIFNFKSWALRPAEEKINELVKECKTESDKQNLIDYLLNKIKGKYPYNSLVIVTAILDAIYAFGIFNEEVENFLRGALTLNKNKPKLRATQVLIKFGCAVDINLFKALSCASQDKYQDTSTWIAREALSEIGKITHSSMQLIQAMLPILNNNNDELIVAAIFASLGNAYEVREQVKNVILTMKLSRTFHAYVFVALCHLGYEYEERTIDEMINYKVSNLIPEIPFLLEKSKSSQLINKAFDFLTAQPPTYQILMVVRKLLDKKLTNLKNINIKKYLIDAFKNKYISVAVVQIFIDYKSVDNSTILQLLNASQPGVWLIDGGLPAISCLADYFNKDISDFIIKVINEKIYEYGVSYQLVACCKKIAENSVANPDNLKLYIKVLGDLFVRLTNANENLVEHLNDLLDIIKAIESTRSLTAFIEAVCDVYSDTQQDQYLWLLMLFAQAKSLAIIFDKEQTIVIGSNLLITKMMNIKLSSSISQKLHGIKEQLVKVNLIPNRTIITNLTAPSTPAVSVKILTNFSGLFVKDGEHNIKKVTNVDDWHENTLK